MKEPHVLTIFIESKNFRFFSNFHASSFSVKNICAICTGVDVEIFVNI